MVTMPSARARRYSEKDSARVRTMPRTPDWPYMIEMVSTKTLRARDPDHSERTKPSDSRSKRGPEATSSIVGSRVSSMTSSVRNWEA